jgi:hypothetical protein
MEYGMLASSQFRLHWQYEAGSPLFCSQSLTMLFCASAGYTGLAGDVGPGDGAGLLLWHAVMPKEPARVSAVITRTFLISISPYILWNLSEHDP